VLEGHNGRVWTALFYPRKNWLLSASGDGDNSIRIWDLATWECIHILEKHKGQVLSLSIYDPKGLLASCGEDDTIVLWNLATLEHMKTMQIASIYKGVNLYGVKGLSEAQLHTMKVLGAVDIP
jgi:WD40 repeat protein